MQVLICASAQSVGSNEHIDGRAHFYVGRIKLIGPCYIRAFFKSHCRAKKHIDVFLIASAGSRIPELLRQL
jgi:hypothetical protein